MNQTENVTEGSFLRSKQAVTVAIELINWLRARGISVAEVSQADLDAWVAQTRSTGLLASGFITWAKRSKLVDRRLTIPKHRRGTSTRLDAHQQEVAISQVLDPVELTPRDRAAAILVIIFGQQMVDVASLTWDKVVMAGDYVTIRLGAIDIVLPHPLDEPWRKLYFEPTNSLTAAHREQRWVFPSTYPGRHIAALHLRLRLKRVFKTRAARLGTLHELTKATPVAILADALGYAPETLERHAIDSASAYERYVQAIGETRSSSR